MRTTWRRFVRVVIALAVLVALLVVAVAVLLPRDELRDLATARLAALTGGQVELGAVSLQWGLGLGVTLDGGRLQGTGEALARASGTRTAIESYVLDLDRVDVRVALLPLLRKRLTVKNIRLDGSLLEARWDQGEVAARDFRLRLSGMSLEPAAAPEARRTQPGPAPLGELIPADLTADVEASVGWLILQGVAYDEVALTGRLEDKVFAVPAVSARRSTGTLTGNFTVDYAEDPWGQLRFFAAVAAVPAVALLEPWVPELAAQLDSELDAEVGGTCSLRDRDTALRSLLVAGFLEGHAGVLRAGPWLAEASPYLGARQDLKNIAFDGLSQAFKVKNGRYYVDNLHIDGRETTWYGSGWVGFAGDIDLGIRVKLPPGFTPELGQWSFVAAGLRDAQGRMNLAFRLTGQSVRPTVGIDLGGMARAVPRQTQKEAAAATRKGLGDLLDKWKTR
jgi:hypothetical protein